MKVTAIANSNIALVKYWGKRDKKLFLPQNSSISVTLDKFNVKATVEFDKKYKEDLFILNQKKLKKGSEEYDKYIGLFLNKVRRLAKTNLRVKIISESNFPSSVGLASSAAGFAALTTALNKALNIGLEGRELTILTRQGSGSSARSIYGGFVEWRRGRRKDGLDSFAKHIAGENYWQEFRIIVCLTSKKEKKIKSRAGMVQTVKTSPMYKGWLATVSSDLKRVRGGIIERNFSRVGKTAEENCLKMHSLMITTKPPIIYWNAGTMDIIHAVMDWREKGIECYFTIDAGPQVKILCLEKDVKEIKKRLKKIRGIQDITITQPGRGARIINNHLF